jgi:O-antigen ligase
MQRFLPPLRGPAFAAAGRPGVPAPVPNAVTPIAGEARNGAWVALLGFYILTFTVPIAELLIVYWHIHIPVVVIAGFVLTLGLVLTRRVGAFWQTPLAKPWMVVMVLFILASILGDYPGRSVPFILQYVVRFHIFPVYCCAIAVSTKNVRHVFSWVGWGSFLLLLLCLSYGKIEEGRLSVPQTDLANPNDLGLALLFAMSGLLLAKSRLSRLLIALALPVFVYEILQTGSRACLVTLVAVSLILFALVSTRAKIVMAVLVPGAAAIVLTLLPSFTVTRLMLIVADPTRVQTDNGQLRGALDSQAARTELQERAIQLAIRHPIFGVGALMFADAVEGMVENLIGKKSGWQGAHNTYLEVAAENGIPAMLLYTWSLLLCLKLNYQAYRMCRGRPDRSDLATQSLALILMTLAFVICTFFSNNAYDPRVCVLVGLSAANFLAMKRESQDLGKSDSGALPPMGTGRLTPIAVYSGVPPSTAARQLTPPRLDKWRAKSTPRFSKP